MPIKEFVELLDLLVHDRDQPGIIAGAHSHSGDMDLSGDAVVGQQDLHGLAFGDCQDFLFSFLNRISISV